MGGLAAILFLPVLAYIVAQIGRDIRARMWIMSIWGVAAALILIWMIVPFNKNFPSFKSSIGTPKN